MATARRCLAQLSLSSLRPTVPAQSLPAARYLSATAPLAKKDKGKKKAPEQKYKKKTTDVKKKKTRAHFRVPDTSPVTYFSLCDAMR